MQPHAATCRTPTTISRWAYHPDRFLTDVVATRQPAIITGLVNQWPAFTKWTPAYFQARFAHVRSRVVLNMPTSGTSYDHVADDFLHEMNLQDFVEHMLQTQRPCYFRRQDIRKLTGLERDVVFQSFTPSVSTDPTYVWLGSAGTRTGLHFDQQDNVLCQLHGQKAVWLIAPEASRHVYPYPGSVTKSQVSPDAPDLQRFPRFAQVDMQYAILQPGEALFIPHRWWHSVISLSPSISLSHEFGEKTNLRELAYSIHMGGLSSWLTVSKDFFWHGLLNRPFTRRLGDDPPFGQLLFTLLRSSLVRRT
ncbi:lysine-specific demethylase 8 [Chitinivorax tropicus]|uniref:Lysine-specific demethylase 8 n=1 Tax=Chitinivorax tropicus TaxID=714531 RepID=A0A840MW05_9PROT|nr:cupin-like domain-containing protein [Chitinivorax tropicus]MBB5020553.1 lysine-specific demethylase 8 [Chitinivorax tropicus]